jgi:hypothetical protein
LTPGRAAVTFAIGHRSVPGARAARVAAAVSAEQGPTMRRSRLALPLAIACAFAGSACVSREVAPAVPAVVAPTLVIEQFMRAVNTNDVETMARNFGTRDGSVLRLDPRRQTEERMFAIASILRHQDYSFQGDEIVPGRRDEAVQILVRVVTAQSNAIVPFTMVLSRHGSWLVESIALERLTNPR